MFGNATEMACPNGAVGTAVRNCSTEGHWEEPNMLNCTSQEFLELEVQVGSIDFSYFQVLRKFDLHFIKDNCW